MYGYSQVWESSRGLRNITSCNLCPVGRIQLGKATMFCETKFDGDESVFDQGTLRYACDISRFNKV